MIHLHLLIALPNGCARYRPPEGGTTVTITGTNFTGATAVRFGAANAASFVVNSDTEIIAVSPPA